MKKKYFILLIILLILLSIYPCYKLATKPNSNKKNEEEKIKIDTWPDEPYGFEYLDEWQKELFYILRDELEVGETYYFEPKSALYVGTVLQMLYYEPSDYCIGYGTPKYSGNAYINNEKNNIVAITKIKICTEGEEKYIEEKSNEIITEINNFVEKYNGDIEKKIELVTTYIYENVEYYTSDEVNDYEMASTIYGTLANGKANCVGQAKTVNFLLKKLGIYSINYAHKNAYTNGIPHLCNLVYINGKYHLLDTPYMIFLGKYDFTEEYVNNIIPPTTYDYNFNN